MENGKEIHIGIDASKVTHQGGDESSLFAMFEYKKQY